MIERITLKNQDKIPELKGYKPSSFKEVASKKIALESLVDTGIVGYKEITDLNKISFGHFILLEKLLAIPQDGDKKALMLMPIVLRPLDEVKLDNEDVDKESKHKEAILDLPIGVIYGSFNRFLELRKTYLYKTYNGVIYGTLEESEDDDTEEEEEGTRTDSSQSARQFHNEKFFWHNMVADVSGNNIFKFQETVELMMYEVMPFLAEKRSKEIVEYLEHKASMI